MFRGRTFFLVVAAVVALGACSGGSDSEVVTDGTSTEAAADVPAADPSEETAPVEAPDDGEAPEAPAADVVMPEVPADPASLTYPAGDDASLEAFLNPLVEEFGVRFQRGSLVNRGDEVYEASATGTHLALYVEPLEPFTDDQFVVNTWAIAARVTPVVFNSYSGVMSYDICQVPYTDQPREGTPPPVTQVDIDRQTAAEIDWANGSLADLLVGLQDPEATLTVRLNPELQQTPAFVAALSEAGL